MNSRHSFEQSQSHDPRNALLNVIHQGIERGGLQLRTERTNESIPLESVVAVSELKSARKTGILCGVVIGLGAGLLVASQADEATVTNEENDWLTDTYYAVVGGLLGGAIGGVVGSAFNSWKPVYP